mgnify:CR=1 FL=1
MTNEIAEFKYETLDDSTAEFLRKKESNMREIVGKAYTELGRELKEAQEVLRKQGSSEGTFMAWYQSLGFSSMQVSRFIQRFELLTLCEEPVREILEELPVTLTYEIAKPSAESTPAKSQAKAEVLDGKIDTLKAYKQRIQELETQAQLAEEKRKQAESLAETARNELDKVKEVYGEPSIFTDGAKRVTNGDAVTYAVFAFQEDTRKLIEKYSYLTHFKREFDNMIDEGKEAYIDAIDSAMHFLQTFKQSLLTKEATIINQ